MRILVVEDERKVASFLQRGLEAEGYSVEVAHDGDAGLARALSEPFDLLLLDVMLPGRDGMAVLRELRRESRTVPVLLLTARSATEDKVAGLDLGADDYLTKPFDWTELLARVRALLRRGVPGTPLVLVLADLSLDPATRRVTRAGQAIELTPREFALLDFFLRNPGRVLSRAVIAQHVWGISFDTFTNVIDVYVNYLRRKIDDGHAVKLLHTVRGVGYVLRDASREAPARGAD
ncbi:MAG: response regulator transcription factor [bacterium]|nr:response regulator transcription factor [bacterium]